MYKKGSILLSCLLLGMVFLTACGPEHWKIMISIMTGQK